MASWSYAFRRILILLAVIADTWLASLLSVRLLGRQKAPRRLVWRRAGPRSALAIWAARYSLLYSMISVTTPEPTVRPPSRMANRRPWSIAIGWISSIVISTLSPGITISTPSGRLATPVTSVVRK